MKNTFLACCILISVSVHAQTNVSGYVYNDLNRNNQKERNEKGVSGVAVSNGKDVVLTKADGKYTLPVSNDNIIFVIKPEGYQLHTDGNNLPLFFYTHKPSGSPKLKFKGVAPSGKLPTSVNFALIPKAEKSEFSALIFGDPQPYNKQEVDYFARGIVSEVEGIKNVEFGLSLGDLVGNDLSLFNPYMEAVKKVSIPWFNLMGNHDMNFDATTDSLADETYEAHFGPANYAFNYGKAHFIVLDDVLYPDPRDSKGYWAGFRADQLEFIKNDLQFVPKDKLIVLAFHIPISEGEGDSFRDEDRTKLFDLLKDYPHTLSMSAHTHIQKHDFFTRREGWKQEKAHHHFNAGTTSGDWYSGQLDEKGIPLSTMRDGTPKGYSFIHFKGNQYVIDYKVAGKPADYQIEVFAPKVIVKGKGTSAGIYANFFMGSQNDSVKVRVDNGPWSNMVRIDEYAPTFMRTVQDWDYTDELISGRRPSNPIPSTHLWRSNIPANLEIGQHSIEVSATDIFGRTFTGKGSYRIEENKPDSK